MAPQFLASFWLTAGDCHPIRDAGVSRVPLEVRVEAAAAAGFSGFAFSGSDLQVIRRDPRWREYRAILRLLESHGLGVIELEVLDDWFLEDSATRHAQANLATLIEAAAELGAHHIKAVGDMRQTLPVERMVPQFAALSEQVARTGARIGIELTPLANLATPRDALKLIQDAGASNAGLLLDSWQIARAGIRYEELAQIPASRIIGVELEDAVHEVRGTLLEDTMNHRLLCGDGDLDLARFVRAIQSAGYNGLYGLEMVSEAHRARLVQEATLLAIEAARRLFLSV